MEIYMEWCGSRVRSLSYDSSALPLMYPTVSLRNSRGRIRSQLLIVRPHSEDASYRQSGGKNTEGDGSNNVHGIESLRVESERVDEKHARENGEGKVASGSSDRHV